MAQITKHFEHLLAFSQLHNGVDLLGVVINVYLEDFNDILMWQFPLILKFFNNLDLLAVFLL